MKVCLLVRTSLTSLVCNPFFVRSLGNHVWFFHSESNGIISIFLSPMESILLLRTSLALLVRNHSFNSFIMKSYKKNDSLSNGISCSFLCPSWKVCLLIITSLVSLVRNHFFVAYYGITLYVLFWIQWCFFAIFYSHNWNFINL